MTHARPARALFACAVLAFACADAAAQPAPTAYDSTFGTDGRTYVNIGAPAAFQLVGSARQQNDGKLVIGGNAAIAGECGGIAFARLNLDGTLDTTYGSGGWLSIAPAQNCYGQPMTLHAMGMPQYGNEVVFVGRSEGYFASGVVQGDFNSYSLRRDPSVPASFEARAVAALQYSGYLVAGSDSREPAGAPGRTTAFVRLDSSAYLDYSYGTNGRLKMAFGTENDEAIGLAVDWDGSWWVAGTTRDAGSATGNDMYVAKFRVDGTPDLPWGGNGNGRRIVDLEGGDDIAASFARDPQYRFVIGGSSLRPGSSQRVPALVRLTVDGMPTPDFGFGNGVKYVLGGAYEEDGSFSTLFPIGWNESVAGGTFVNRSTGARRMFLYKYDNGGFPASWFGSQGLVFSTAMTDPRGFFLGDGYGQTFFAAATANAQRLMLAKYDGFGADPSYGGGIGRAFDAMQPGTTHDEGGAMAFTPDGGLVLVGQGRLPYANGVVGGIVKLTAAGQRDLSFGTASGVAYLEMPSGYEQNFFPRAVASHLDGRIVVASTASGPAGTRPIVSRLLPDGNRDPSWNAGSAVILPLPAGVGMAPRAIAAYPSGAVLLAGDLESYPWRIALFRLLPDGSPDTTFGVGGLVRVPSADAGPSESVMGLMLLDDERIVVTGQANDSSSASRFAVIRLMPDGMLDSSWGVGGKGFGPPNGAGFGLARQPDGKIVAGGDCESGAYSCLVRFTLAGVPDPAFGMAGVSQSTLGSMYNGFVGVAVQADGKIVAGGDGGGTYQFTLARVHANGTPDTSFSGGYALSLSNALAMSFGMTPEGKLVIAGYGSGDLAVARHMGGGDDSPDAFTFASASDVAPSTVVASAPVTPAGYTTPAQVFVDIGEVAVGNCQAWSASGSVSIQPGQALCVRHTSAAQVGSSVTSTVTIGGTQATFTSTTTALDTVITSRPASPAPTQVSFEFVSVPAGATFECRLDGAAFEPCTSPRPYGGLSGGAHSFAVRAVMGASVDATPASYSFTVDATPPETSITSGPTGTVPTADATFAFASDDAAATFECRIDTSPFLACSSPSSYTGIVDGAHTFEVRAVDAAGNRDATPASRAWTVDRQAPDTYLISGPSDSVNVATASFTFASDDAAATYECRLDGGAFAACASPKGYSALADGAHVFEVRAVDAAGNRDATPASRTWTVDTQGPLVSIGSGPPATSNSNAATFSFGSIEAGATFECRLDGATYAACTSPKAYAGLAEGSHTFDVRGVDAAGNRGVPASRTWTVDTTAPETTLTSAPSGVATSTSATLAFQSSETGSTFRCRLDGAAFATCTSPVTLNGLAQGTHVFEVYATDGADNADASPATASWSVDTQGPDVAITSGPSGTVASTSATFAFGSTEAGAAFECRLDGAAFAACTSPRTYGNLADGSHAFEVRAIDAYGNRGAAAARAWSIDSAPPETTVTSAPVGTVASTSATIAFQSSEAGSSFQCRLDGAAFAGCASPVSLGSLSQGAHTFQVYAVDASGNADATPASATWSVDTLPPETTISEHPYPITQSSDAQFNVTVSEPWSSTRCRIDGGSWFACGGGPQVFHNFAAGPHSFEAQATDLAGNVDPTPAVFNWTVDFSYGPDSRITSAPSGSVASTTATIAFDSPSGTPAVAFECAFAGARFACSSPYTLTGLADGEHTFIVKAIDAEGNVDRTPAAVSWIVDTVAPDTALASGPSGSVAQTTAAFTFTANEPSATFQCSLDGAAYVACASGVSYASLANGVHVFNVRARDAAGNLDASPASRTWTVDLVAPDTTITGGPSGNNQPPTATFTFTSTEPGGTFECRLDGAAFAACASGITYNALPKGPHTFEVRAIDAAGNVDATPATRSWRSN